MKIQDKKFNKEEIKKTTIPSPTAKNDTDEYVYKMKKGNNNILVAVRVRPLSALEIENDPQKLLRVMEEKLILIKDLGHNGPEDAFRGFRPKSKPYAFDFAFDDNVGQDHVYDSSTRFLIDGLVDGFNATVFCYGATGAGKTYTMLGTKKNPGIMYQAIKDLLALVITNSEYKFKLHMWYVEVYNENLNDLLQPEKENRLDIREDGTHGVTLAGAKEVSVASVEDIMELLEFGNKNRTKESTWINSTSSRSHAVLQVTIEKQEKVQAGNEEIAIAKLTLIDLAGSERASMTKNKGMRLIEGANINRSLLALGNCINALADVQAKNVKSAHILFCNIKK